jgi:uncharacterized OsmC-like protein
MVKISIQYEGELRCSAIHGPSKRRLETDAPVDNQGKGESFSPTDLVATALGTCMATVMGIFAKRHEINLQGMKIEVSKEMTSEGPRKIAKLRTEIWIPVKKTHEKSEMLERAALTCPVHHSLDPEMQKPVTVHWAD